jgi:hypothetical protein
MSQDEVTDLVATDSDATTDVSNPPEDVIQLLNDVSYGWIGIDKPLVEHVDESQEDYSPDDIGY